MNKNLCYFKSRPEYLQNCLEIKGDYFLSQSKYKTCRYLKCGVYDLRLNPCKDCKTTFYCSDICQQLDWARHKAFGCSLRKRKKVNPFMGAIIETSTTCPTELQWKDLEKKTLLILLDDKTPILPENIFIRLRKDIDGKNFSKGEDSLIYYIMNQNSVSFLHDLLDLGLNPQLATSFLPYLYFNSKMYDLLHHTGNLSWSHDTIWRFLNFYSSTSNESFDTRILFLQWLREKNVIYHLDPRHLSTLIQKIIVYGTKTCGQALRWIASRYEIYFPYLLEFDFNSQITWEVILNQVSQIKKERYNLQYHNLYTLSFPKVLVLLILNFLEGDLVDFIV